METHQDGISRVNIQIGATVDIVQKHHQRSGEITTGVVIRLLTKSSINPTDIVRDYF